MSDKDYEPGDGLQSFRDQKGRLWDCAVTVDVIKRVKRLVRDESTGRALDLRYLDQSDLLQRLLSDPVLICDVLYAVIKPQADAYDPQVSDEEFARGLYGDTLAAAQDALLEGLISFSPSPKRRKALRAMLKKVKQLDALAVEQSAELLEGDQLETAMQEAMAHAVEDLKHSLSSSGNGSTSTSLPTNGPES